MVGFSHRPLAALLGVAAALMAGPGMAQPRPIEGGDTPGGPRKIGATAGKPWKHEATKLVFPATLGGIPRTAIYDYGAGEWDVMGQYELAERSSILSIYIYESQAPDAALAFATSNASLKARSAGGKDSMLGQIRPIAEATPFALAGQTVRSGMRISYAADGPYRSTALATAPFGARWLFKIRLTSKTKTAEKLDALLSQVIAELKWPDDKVTQPAAAEIAACSPPMPPLERSADVRGKSTQGIMNIVLGPAASDIGRLYENGFSKPRYCRDAMLPDGSAVYRLPDKAQHYVIAVGDNGSVVVAERDVLGPLLAMADNPGDPDARARAEKNPDFSVTLYQPGEAIVFFPQDRLPPPEQAIEMLGANRWVVKSMRTAKGERLQMNPEVIR